MFVFGGRLFFDSAPENSFLKAYNNSCWLIARPTCDTKRTLIFIYFLILKCILIIFTMFLSLLWQELISASLV